MLIDYLTVLLPVFSLRMFSSRHDGSFHISNVEPGSYAITVVNPNHIYEPVRVDINSKGKFRARKLNYVQTNLVQQVPYPLKFKVRGPFKYFQVREAWRITDFLMNPMVSVCFTFF